MLLFCVYQDVSVEMTTTEQLGSSGREVATTTNGVAGQDGTAPPPPPGAEDAGVPASGAIVPGGPNGPDGTISEEVKY